MTEHDTILVTGATGNQGGATARHLLSAGHEVRALTRNPHSDAAQTLAHSGATLITGDLDQPHTLEAAMNGVSAVFSVQNVVEAGDDGEARQGIALIDAAKAAGVDFVVQASGGGVERAPTNAGFAGKAKVEEHLRTSGLNYAIIRPTWFMSNWAWPFPQFADGIAQGELRQPLNPETLLQLVSPDDIGAAAAAAFTHPADWNKREVELAGDEMTIADVAKTLGEAKGHAVEYQQVAWDEWRTQLGDFFHDLYRWIEDDGYKADLRALNAEGLARTSFANYLSNE